MKISLTVDTEIDYKNKNYKKTVDGIKNLLELDKKYNIKPTLFVTCDCIEKYPDLFNKLKNKGWEISLHGYRHERFDEMSKEKKEMKIEKAINCFKKYLKIKPCGLRAPQFSSDFDLIELAEKSGFSYDSSTVQFPLSQLIFFRRKFKLYWNQMFFKNKIRKNKLKIKEIPVSSFVLPISMFTLRKIPFFMFKILATCSLLFRKDKTLVFLSHSYEFEDKNIEKLEKLIRNYKNIEFTKMEDIE